MMSPMARWESGSRERLADAALRLFASQGFEQTTVAEIAAEAGLTERTFFRYYADKREVLFGDQGAFEAGFLRGLAACPSTDPMELIAATLEYAAAFFSEERRAWSRSRQRVLADNPALAERETNKMSTLAGVLTDALVERGIEPTRAALAAEAGISVFRRAFAAWIAEDETRPFLEIQRDVLTQLRQLLS